MTPEQRIPKHLASKQWAAARVRLAETLSYCLPSDVVEGELEVVVDAAGGEARRVGHTAGQLEMWICSPWAMSAKRAVIYQHHSTSDSPSTESMMMTTTHT